MLWNEYPSASDDSYVNPDQAAGGHQETNPDVCVEQAQSALPSPLGQRFSSRASHCVPLPVTAVVRKL